MKKLKQQIIIPLLTITMLASTAHEEFTPLPNKTEYLKRPAYSCALEPEAKDKFNEEKTEENIKDVKQPLSFHSLWEHFSSRLREAILSKSKSFVLSILRKIVSCLLVLFFTLFWPLLSLFDFVKEKFSETLSYLRFYYLAKALSILLLLGVYFLVPAERRVYLHAFIVVWSIAMLGLSLWTSLSKKQLSALDTIKQN